MGLLESFLKGIPGDVHLRLFLGEKEAADIRMEGKTILVDVKNPIIAVEAMLKQLSEGKEKSQTLGRLKKEGYQVKIKWKGLEFGI